MSKSRQVWQRAKHNNARYLKQTVQTGVTMSESRQVWPWANQDRCDNEQSITMPATSNKTVQTGVNCKACQFWLPQRHNPGMYEQSISSWWSGHSLPPCTPGALFVELVSCAQGHHQGHRWSSQTASACPSFCGCHWKKVGTLQNNIFKCVSKQKKTTHTKKLKHFKMTLSGPKTTTPKQTKSKKKKKNKGLECLTSIKCHWKRLKCSKPYPIKCYWTRLKYLNLLHQVSLNKRWNMLKLLPQVSLNRTKILLITLSSQHVPLSQLAEPLWTNTGQRMELVCMS